jgi:hypothetical protein
MLITNIYRDLILNIKNFPGRSAPRKIVTIECDDWGGIRIPSKEVYGKLLKAGLPVDTCRYRFDTLESIDDLQQLFHLLESIKGNNGHEVVMTPLTTVANPDFKKIKQSDFSEYHYEKFTETLLGYGRGPEVIDLWKKGISKGIFVPELHGREHISVQVWLQKLREGNKDLLYAFENGYISLNINDVKPAANSFRAEFYFDSITQIPFLEKSIKTGVDLFVEIFGYTPRIFVPSNAIFHPIFEQKLAETGVKYLNVWHFNPILDKNGNIKSKYYRNGKRTSAGITYYVRNCSFEPTDQSYFGIESTLKQISAAFRWRKPAIISTHRVNFVGGIDPANREFGLTELKRLLKEVLKRWPDVEFMSSSDMFKVLYPNN